MVSGLQSVRVAAAPCCSGITQGGDQGEVRVSVCWVFVGVSPPVAHLCGLGMMSLIMVSLAGSYNS